MKRKPLDGQLQLDIFERPTYTPGNCPNEGTVVDIGGGKSFCEPWDCWTNCRAVGHCVYEEWKE